MAATSELTARRRAPIDAQSRRGAECYESRIADEAVKENQRSLVYRHLARFHNDRELMRVLSLPDDHWTFERLVESHRGDLCEFLCMQRAWSSLERGTCWMPGDEVPHSFAERIEIGNITGFANSKSRVMFGHAGHILSLKLAELHKGTKSQVKMRRRAFNGVYRNTTAVWLDFNGQLCPEVQKALSRLFLWIKAKRQCVPIVISILAARDGCRSDEQRVASTASLLDSGRFRKFSLTEVWRHQSAESPYLSIAGVMRLVNGAKK